MNTGKIMGKVLIEAMLKLESGLHIGATESGLEVGGIDSPVIRDPITMEPYIPGSSLKGKIRSLLEKLTDKDFNKHSGKDVYRHECSDPNCQVCRLFGSAGGKDEKNMPSRIAVRDARLTPESLEELKHIDTGLLYTEWKTENSLDRVTSAASPRQLERVPAGSLFNLSIVYTIDDEQQAEEDLKNILATLKLLEDDALGGGGSRGNGNISFSMKAIKKYPKVFYTHSDERTVKVSDMKGKRAKEIEAGKHLSEILN